METGYFRHISLLLCQVDVVPVICVKQVPVFLGFPNALAIGDSWISRQTLVPGNLLDGAP
jgi:hypothetical protein